MPRKAILFDWGDTLVSFPGLTPDPERHLRCLHQLYLGLASNSHALCFDRNEIDWPTFLASYKSTCAEQLAFSRATLREHRLEDRMEATFRGAGCVCTLDQTDLESIVWQFCDVLLSETRPVEGAHAVLRTLADHYRLAIVSNYPFPPLVFQNLERFGLRPLFATVVVSGNIGWIKPDRRPFRQALTDLRALPSEALFVGDTFETDIRGAQAAGMEAVWLTGEPASDVSDTTANYGRISRLADLLRFCSATTHGEDVETK